MLDEVMIALGMVVVGMLGLLSLLSSSIGINKVVADQYVASYLAAEGIEVFKNIVDNNVASGVRAFNDSIGGEGVEYEIQYDTVQVNPSDEYDLGNPHFFRFGGVGGQPLRYNYQQGGQTPFIRHVSWSALDAPAYNKLRVRSMVEWTSRGGAQYQIVLEDYFYNWRQ